jgi:hypothetical protein
MAVLACVVALRMYTANEAFAHAGVAVLLHCAKEDLTGIQVQDVRGVV